MLLSTMPNRFFSKVNKSSDESSESQETTKKEKKTTYKDMIRQDILSKMEKGQKEPSSDSEGI